MFIFLSVLFPVTGTLLSLQGKALSMTDQFSLPNSQCMISTMAAMGFYSKPLLDICSKRIQGKKKKQLINSHDLENVCYFVFWEFRLSQLQIFY